MGCACLRGDGHRWPLCGAGCVAAGGRQAGSVAHEPDAARADAGAYFLRRCCDTDAVGLSDRNDQPEAVPDPNTVSDPVTLGQSIGYRDRRSLSDAMPITVGASQPIRVADAKWQRETLDLALSQAPLHPTPGEQDRRSGPVVSASSQRITVLTGRV
jgi:hypothetical protein